MQRPEDIDLRSVGRSLAQAFQHHPPQGYLRGKTVMRDHLEQALGFSSLQAEELVDTLESRGFLRFSASAQQPSLAEAPWTIDWDRRE